jgi:hypothetical protein
VPQGKHLASGPLYLKSRPADTSRLPRTVSDHYHCSLEVG